MAHSRTHFTRKIIFVFILFSFSLTSFEKAWSFCPGVQRAQYEHVQEALRENLQQEPRALFYPAQMDQFLSDQHSTAKATLAKLKELCSASASDGSTTDLDPNKEKEIYNLQNELLTSLMATLTHLFFIDLSLSPRAPALSLDATLAQKAHEHPVLARTGLLAVFSAITEIPVEFLISGGVIHQVALVGGAMAAVIAAWQSPEVYLKHWRGSQRRLFRQRDSEELHHQAIHRWDQFFRGLTQMDDSPDSGDITTGKTWRRLGFQPELVREYMIPILAQALDRRWTLLGLPPSSDETPPDEGGHQNNHRNDDTPSNHQAKPNQTTRDPFSRSTQVRKCNDLLTTLIGE